MPASSHTTRYHAMQPLRCGATTRPPGDTERNATPQYALVYVVSGRVEVAPSHGPRQCVRPGDAFARFPHEPHDTRYLERTHTCWVAIPEGAYNAMKDAGLPTWRHRTLTLDVAWGFPRRHARLQKLFASTPPHRRAAVLAAAQSLLIDAHLHAHQRTLDEHGTTWIADACQALEADLDRPLRLPQLAARLGVGYATFRKCFKQATGYAPGDYRLERRLQAAEHMLLANRSISEIAEALGYTDIYAFSSQFKRKRGLSPSHWRRQSL